MIQIAKILDFVKKDLKIVTKTNIFETSTRNQITFQVSQKNLPYLVKDLETI